MRREIGCATLRARLSELARVQTKNENTFRGWRKIRFRNFLSSVALCLYSRVMCPTCRAKRLSYLISSLKSKSVQQRVAVPTPPLLELTKTHIDRSLWLCHFVCGKDALYWVTIKRGCLKPVFTVKGPLKGTKSTLGPTAMPRWQGLKRLKQLSRAATDREILESFRF